MKKLAITMAVLMACSSLLAGCKSQTGTKSSGKVPSALNLTVMSPNFGKSPAGTDVQKQWQTEMESYLGCKLNITWNYVPWADYSTKEQTVEATGSIPDIMTYASYNYNQSAGNAGILLDIAPYIKKKAVSNYQQYINGTPYSQQAIYTSDGHSWGFLDGMNNSHNDYSAQSVSTMGIRFDIFKKYNIQMPETLDELEQAALKLKQLFPDVYPINISAKSFTMQFGLAQTFHTSTTVYWNGSKYSYGPEEDNYKAMLQYLNKLYSEKLIDPNFLTDTDDQATAKAETGKVFILPSIWAGNVTVYNQAKKDASMEWGSMMLPKDSKYGTPWTYLTNKPGKTLQQRFGIEISKKAPYPDLVVKMLDYQYSDKMSRLCQFGIEGKTYTTDSKGNPQFISSIASAANPGLEAEKYGVGASMGVRPGIVFNPQIFDANLQLITPQPWYHAGKYTSENYWTATAEYGGKAAQNPDSIAPIINLTKDEQTQKSTAQNSADTYAQTAAAKFITGQMNFNSWSSYLSQLNSTSQINSAISKLNEKYKALNTKK